MTCGGYPDGVWEQDPRAPWNRPDPWEGMSCGDCMHFGEVKGAAREMTACFADVERGEMEAFVVSEDDDACERYEPWGA